MNIADSWGRSERAATPRLCYLEIRNLISTPPRPYGISIPIPGAVSIPVTASYLYVGVPWTLSSGDDGRI